MSKSRDRKETVCRALAFIRYQCFGLQGIDSLSLLLIVRLPTDRDRKTLRTKVAYLLLGILARGVCFNFPEPFTLFRRKMIHSFNKYFLSSCYVPEIVLGIRTTSVSKTDMILNPSCLAETDIQQIY